LAIQKEMAREDIVLIKGSRSMHLEEIVKEIMAQPQKADRFLAE